MMFLKKNDKKGQGSVWGLTVGALAMVGAFNVVKCVKRTVRGCSAKMKSMVKKMTGSADSLSD